MSEEFEEILIEKMNKELDNIIRDASGIKKITAVSIMVMKQPIILLFLSILSDYERVLKENKELKEESEECISKQRIKDLLREAQEYDLSYKDEILFNLLQKLLEKEER